MHYVTGSCDDILCLSHKAKSTAGTAIFTAIATLHAPRLSGGGGGGVGAGALRGAGGQRWGDGRGGGVEQRDGGTSC